MARLAVPAITKATRAAALTASFVLATEAAAKVRVDGGSGGTVAAS